MIFNDNHNKCIKVESPTSVTVAPCDPRAKEQQFRWASESRLLSLSLKLCLGAMEIKDWVKVVLFECDEKSNLQHWQCKNETLFGLKGQDLHLNWGNRNERNIMIYKGSGLWSRWLIYDTKGDLCSRGYQGRSFGVYFSKDEDKIVSTVVCKYNQTVSLQFTLEYKTTKLRIQ